MPSGIGTAFIDPVRDIPEAMKPRGIKIETAEPAKRKVLEGKAA